MKITTLHVIRHGQTTWNAAGRIQGQSDSPLSELGRQQAEKVAEALAARPLAAIYSSDLTRARDTAAPLAARLGLEPVLEPRLRERSYGILETLTWPEVRAAHPELYAGLAAGDGALRLPEGESREDLFDRIGPAFEAIANAHPGEEIAVVTHGGVKAAFFARVVGLAASAKPPLRTLNGAISTFERWGEELKLVTWGSVAHIEGLVSPRPAPGTASTA